MTLQEALFELVKSLLVRYYSLGGVVLILLGLFSEGDSLEKMLTLIFGCLLLAIDKNSAQTEALDKKISKLLDADE